MRILLLGFLVVASCGKVETPGSRVGGNRTFQPLALSSSEKSTLTRVCHSLRSKRDKLPYILNSQFTFTVTQKACGEEAFGPGLDIPVQIQKPFDRFIFKRVVDGTDFVFPDVETDTSGIMGEICSRLPELENPFKTKDGRAIWISTSAMRSDCDPRSNEQCIQLETGTPEGEIFEITTMEWLKFNLDINSGTYGFFLQRKMVSRGLCGSRETFETQALLK